MGYTHVTATVSGALEALSVLSNQERPDKLSCALGLLGIPVPLNCIQMSEYYDGYTIRVTESQKAEILEIHQLRRQNFHITQKMAKHIYQEVERRYCARSEQSTNMNSFSNTDMYS